MSIFEKIIKKEIPADIVAEDDDMIAIRDINPQAPVHILIIPKKVIVNVNTTAPEDQALLGRMLLKCKEIAKAEGIAESGYRLVLNVNRHGGQSVDHLHIHLMGGRQMTWPPG